jgi:hypothetical protein
MRSFRESSPPSWLDLSLVSPLPTTFAIGLGTLPLLAALTTGRWISDSALQLGKASEELFRGDRLPSRPLMPED